MKKNEIVFPITEETFPQAWEWVDVHRRKAIVRKYVRKTCSAAGNLVFFVLMLVLMYGYCRQLESANFQAYLQKFPLLPQLWNWLLTHVLQEAWGTWGQLGVLAAMLYGIPFTLEALCSGIVLLCCRPKAKAIPQGSARENSAQLLVETEKLVMSKQARYVSGNGGYNLLYLLLSAGNVAAFAILAALEGKNEVVQSVLMATYSYEIYVYILVVLVGYGALEALLVQLRRLLYILKLPEDLLPQIRDYALQCDPEKKAQIEEEDRILALAEEIKLRRAKEREQLLTK